MNSICWRFPSNNHGENRGFNDSGIEHFKDNIISSLAREICQNSLDAAIDEKKCVNIEFSLFEIPSNEIPGKDDLMDAFERLTDYWKGMSDDKGKYICKKALNTLNNKTCKILRISDFNTTGLSGIKGTDRLSPWYNLVKFTGASDKAGDAGGSKGIGKYSSFACSKLRTVFYSTYNTDNEIAYQGVSRLATFIDDKGETTQGVGYYGTEKNDPVFDCLKLDNHFKREKNNFGTDIYILGYECDPSTWEQEIMGSVLDGFFYAIHTGKLSININGKTLDSLSINQCISDLELHNGTFMDKITPVYYRALIDAEKNNLFFKKDLLRIGTLNIWLIAKEEESGKKSIAMIRKTGMKIYDERRCNGGLNVAGVCYIEGVELNNRLKNLENPTHTGWFTDRDINPKQARALISAIKNAINKTIIDCFSHSNLESVDAMGVGNYLPDTEEDSILTKKKTIINNNLDTVTKRKKRTTKTIITTQDATGGTEVDSSENQEEERFSPDPEGDTPLPNGTHGQGSENKRMGTQDPNGEETEKIIKPFRAASLKKFLPVCVNPQKGQYALIMEPSHDAEEGKVLLFISAETDKFPIDILQAKLIVGDGAVIIEGNSISGLVFKKGSAIRLMVEIDYSDACSLEVEVYAH